MIPKKSLFELAKALEGIPILGSLANTPAARAGIRYGDVLLSVNGVRTKNFADYVEAKALRNDGMELVVFRTGEEQMKTLVFDATAPSYDPAQIVAELVGMGVAPLESDDIVKAKEGPS